MDKRNQIIGRGRKEELKRSVKLRPLTKRGGGWLVEEELRKAREKGKRGRGFRVDIYGSFVLDLRLGQTLQQRRKPEMEERHSKIGRSIFCIGAQIREGFLLYIHLVSVFEYHCPPRRL